MQNRILPGQFLPPEWAPQSAVQLTWPHAYGDWADDLVDAEANFAGIAREISHRQKLVVVCYNEKARKDIRSHLEKVGASLSNILLHVIPSNDVWARDHGPITVLRDEKPILLNFRFNGWGGKYDHDLDNNITRRLYDTGAFGVTAIESVDLVLEGGGIEVNGNGCLLTTERCLLAPTRNPQLTREQLEARLMDLLGIHTIHWLKRGGLEGDDTDGHIDTIARYCSENTIAFQDCDDIDDPHFDELEAMADELDGFRQPNGDPYRLVGLPWPKPIFSVNGDRIPAGYANFLIINDAVLVPTYGDPADTVAIETLRPCFPNREVVGVDCRALIRQFGSLHCVTMQLPAGVVP